VAAEFCSFVPQLFIWIESLGREAGSIFGVIGASLWNCEILMPNSRVPVNSSHGELVTGDEFTVAFFHFCDEFTV